MNLQAKIIIKSIKFKAEIIKCNNDSSRWEIFNNLMKVYSVANYEERRLQINQKLKYTKCSNLEFVKIKVLEAINCSIKEIS